MKWLYMVCTAILLSACSIGEETKKEEVVMVAEGQQVYVARDGSDENDGSEEQPFQTIQHAVDVAATGVTIYVREGVYEEQVTISKIGREDAPITIMPYPNEAVVLDGEDLKVETEGMISLYNSSYITVSGFEIRNYTTKKKNEVPAGIFVSGAGKGIRLLHNHIHHIENTHRDGNAHGIAVYGTEAPEPIEEIEIANNTIENLKLGSSESLVLNGNVAGFIVQNNIIRYNDNIGIDVIGFEGVAPDEEYDQARDGVISGNEVYEISSWGNPAYGKEYAAGGIYVDGGKNITIEHNRVYKSDYGIEAASENKGKYTSNVTIRNNVLYHNYAAGITIGGYDQERGGTRDTTITDNILYQNDTKKLQTGQLYIQYRAVDNVVTNNIFVAGSSHIFMSHSNKEDTSTVLNHNVYYDEGGEQAGRWIWQAAELRGFSTYQEKSGNDANSTFAKPQFVDEKAYDFRLQ